MSLSFPQRLSPAGTPARVCVWFYFVFVFVVVNYPCIFLPPPIPSSVLARTVLPSELTCMKLNTSQRPSVLPFNTSPSYKKEEGNEGALGGLSSGCEILPTGTDWTPVTLALAHLF